MAVMALGLACQPEGPTLLCPSRATHDPSVPGLGAGAHHLPLRTDVRPRPQDHQKPQLSCQVQEGFHIPVPSKVINPRQRLVVVPGDVAGMRGEISTRGLRAPRHDGELSHRLVPLLLGTGLQPGLRIATGAGLGLAPGSCLCLSGASWGSQPAQCKGWSPIPVIRQHPCLCPCSRDPRDREGPRWLWAVCHQGCPRRLHLHSAEPTHVHLEEPVPPGRAWDTGVVDAARDVAERGTILAEAVLLVIQLEGACQGGGLRERGSAGVLQTLPKPSRRLPHSMGQGLTGACSWGAPSPSSVQGQGRYHAVLGEQEGQAGQPFAPPDGPPLLIKHPAAELVAFWGTGAAGDGCWEGRQGAGSASGTLGRDTGCSRREP